MDRFIIVDSCCGWDRPLKKMTVGMFLASLAFVAAALVQMQIDVSAHIHTKRLTQSHYLCLYLFSG